MKFLLALLAACCGFAQAATSVVAWELRLDGKPIARYQTQAACDTAAKALPGTATYECPRLLVVVDPVKPPIPPVPPVPPGVAWKSVTAAMWAEINTQRAIFGDSNDCKARVDAVPTTGTNLAAGGNISAALANSNVVILAGGTYKLSSPLIVQAGKKLVGAAGQAVTIDATGVFAGIYVQNNAVLANVNLEGAQQQGVVTYHAPTDSGSTGTLIYQVSVRRTGLNYASGTTGSGIFVSQGASGNCIVSTEVFDTFNALGAPNDHGGNADGYNNSYGAHHNSFIDSHSYRNGDDGFDMWEGGVVFMYFNTSRDNGKTTGKGATGDGNGVKLGVGSVAHKLYKVDASNNKANGFDINGNSVQPTLVQSTASGNGGQNYAGVSP